MTHGPRKLNKLTVERALKKIAPTGAAVEVVAEGVGQPTSQKGAEEEGASRDELGETAVIETAW